jgi:hypothetical protein
VTLDPDDDFKSAHSIKSILKQEYGIGISEVTIMNMSIDGEVPARSHLISMQTYSFSALLDALRREHKIKDPAPAAALRRLPEGPCGNGDLANSTRQQK